MPRPDCYISIDVESDGPIPGPYSMLSFGMCVAARFDGSVLHVPDPTAQTFYAELRPISDRYVAAALAVSGLDRDALVRDGRDPAEAMAGAAEWVEEVAGEDLSRTLSVRRGGPTGSPIGYGFSAVSAAVTANARRHGAVVVDGAGEEFVAAPWSAAADALLCAAMAFGAPQLVDEVAEAVLTAAWRAAIDHSPTAVTGRRAPRRPTGSAVRSCRGGASPPRRRHPTPPAPRRQQTPVSG